MSERFIPIAQAALELKTDAHYLHKLVKRDKNRLEAYAEKRGNGKLSYWFVDTHCERYKQLAKRLLLDDECSETQGVPLKFPIDWDLWEDMCRAGDKRIVRKKCSDKTIKEYKRYATRFFETYPELSRETLRLALKAYDKNETADKDCTASRQFLYRSMRTIARYYQYKNYVHSTFVEELRFLRPDNSTQTPHRPFHTEATIRSVLKAIPTAQNARKQLAFTEFDIALNSALVSLLFLTGARSGEACAIRIQDVDYKKQLVKLKGKGDKDRTVGLCPEVLKALKDYWAVRPHSDSEYLLLHARGKELRPGYVYNRLQRVSNYANVEDFTPHSLRRTFARWAIQDKKLSMIVVRDALGHTTLAMTNIYARTTEDDVVNAMKNF